jgi:hypothetical protein
MQSVCGESAVEVVSVCRSSEGITTSQVAAAAHPGCSDLSRAAAIVHTAELLAPACQAPGASGSPSPSLARACCPSIRDFLGGRLFHLGPAPFPLCGRCRCRASLLLGCASRFAACGAGTAARPAAARCRPAAALGCWLVPAVAFIVVITCPVVLIIVAVTSVGGVLGRTATPCLGCGCCPLVAPLQRLLLLVVVWLQVIRCTGQRRWAALGGCWRWAPGWPSRSRPLFCSAHARACARAKPGGSGTACAHGG